MKRILYIDPIGGVAGDMLCAALLNAGLDENKWRQGLEALPWTEEVSIERSAVMRGVFSASHISVKPKQSHHIIAPIQPPHGHHHGHHHGHGHSHTHHTVQPANGPAPVAWSEHHRGFTEIVQLIQTAPLPQPVQQMAISVFGVLGEAEAAIHGTSLEDIHFHEVGAVDSIIDIVGVCLGIHLLGIDTMYAGAIPLSSGQIHTAHGLTPLPAPATLRILHGWPSVAGTPNHEQVTPTGAAILKALCQYSPFPAMKILGDGYGAGTRNPPMYPNLVRVCIGESIAKPILSQQTNIIEIQANIDDMSAELLSPLLDHLLAAGALDATLTPILMKKGRAGHLCTILTSPSQKDSVIQTLFRHSTTFGCRFIAKERQILDREWDSVHTEFGTVRMKIGLQGNTVVQMSIEFADAQQVATAHSLSLTEVIPLIQYLHREQFPNRYTGRFTPC